MTVLEMGQTLCLFIYDIVGVSAPTNQGARGEYVFCAPARFVSASGPLLFFQYIKLQVEVNNVFIIFDNCAYKCQN